MGKRSAPATPDYVGATQLQGQLSKEALNMQNYANRPTQVTPFGRVDYLTQAISDPATNQTVTQYTQNTTLSPRLQSALDYQLDTQLGRSALASGFMDRVREEYQPVFDYQNLPQRVGPAVPTSLQSNLTDYTPGLNTAFAYRAVPQIDSTYRDTVANQLLERLRPTQERQQAQLETQLANRGFVQGSEAYNQALTELADRQSRERFQALDQSGAEAQRLFDMQMRAQGQEFGQGLGASQFANQALGQASALDMARMQAYNQAAQQQNQMNLGTAAFQNTLRQQAIAEEMQRRGMSLNELNALLSGQQVALPQMPSFVQSGRAQTPNLLDAAQAQYDAQLGAVNAQNAAFGNLLGAGAQLGSAFLLSDRRLKSNIRRVGTHPFGFGLYTFTLLGFEQLGVIAQEVQAIRPDLVVTHPSGYLMVNYGGL
jgi:hypothetical protein